MLEQYFAQRERSEAEISNYREEIRAIEAELKPIEEKLRPFYDRIRELKNWIEYEKQEIYRGYYMLVRDIKRGTTWLEKIGEYCDESTPGKISRGGIFKQIASNASYEEAKEVANLIIDSWNSSRSVSTQSESKRELVVIIHFDRKKVYENNKAIAIDKWIQSNKQ
ncbi:hypothetical protein ACOMCU_00360 [Lysinibacillus sp. UGB7]|uniref:hypothetical protein n=1 Tax=Lysinibacillus sp. UGB7 TaxID=3411039 RepID=UPI003B78BCD6